MSNQLKQNTGSPGLAASGSAAHRSSVYTWFSSAQRCSSNAGRTVPHSYKLAACQVSHGGEKGTSRWRYSHINLREESDWSSLSHMAIPEPISVDMGAGFFDWSAYVLTSTEAGAEP